jgi:hypothetical protein
MSPRGDNYPIVPTFRQWLFPHNNLPPGWENIGETQRAALKPGERINASACARIQNQSCRLSNHGDCVSFARLCPLEESEWFARNHMSRYTLQARPNGIPVDDVRNIVNLRHDLHLDFDKRKFVFVPKRSATTPTVVVAHMLETTNELGFLYHNCQLHPTPDIAPEFFLTRFAWAIFPLVQGFLGCSVPRFLLRVDSIGNQTAMQNDATTCRLLANIPSTPSRKRPQTFDFEDVA